jgi:drug/metabolite transporter (DMT)-like permease
MVLGEILSAREITGCALIFIANLLVQTADSIKKPA